VRSVISGEYVRESGEPAMCRGQRPERPTTFAAAKGGSRAKNSLEREED